jgi:hypothetical protein
MRLALLLRILASRGQYGHARSPRGYYMSEGYCSFYWDNRGVCPDYPTWRRVARLSSRYLRFCYHVSEVMRGWRQVEEIHHADNSVEVVEVSTSGETRRRMTLAPGGDTC